MSPSVRMLIDLLESPDLTDRRKAAESLARLGPEAAPAAMSLVRACGDPDGEVRDWVVAA